MLGDFFCGVAGVQLLVGCLHDICIVYSAIYSSTLV